MVKIRNASRIDDFPVLFLPVIRFTRPSPWMVTSRNARKLVNPMLSSLGGCVASADSSEAPGIKVLYFGNGCDAYPEAAHLLLESQGGQLENSSYARKYGRIASSRYSISAIWSAVNE